MKPRTTRLLLAMLLSVAGFAQVPAPAGQGGQPTPAVPPPPAAPAAVADYELLVIKPTPYQPRLVRDPFSTPSDVENARKGDLIDDVGVKGRIVSNGKVLAVVIDSRGNARWLPAGYKFRDGELFQITDKAVIFHQRDVNSTSGAFRTVVKSFTREGEK